MSKVISAYDLLLADTLQGMNQFDLCHLDNIDKVNAVLETLGFDVTKPVHIYAAQHRTLKNEVKIGYVFAGEYNLSRQHIKGPYSTLEDVLVAASHSDQSLFEQLHAMSSACVSYGSDMALDENVPKQAKKAERFSHKSHLEYANEYEEEENAITEQIKQLEDILFHIRGSQYKKDGSVKTVEDYKNPEVEVVKKKRKKKLVVNEQSKGNEING
jgi:hypothetical protein